MHTAGGALPSTTVLLQSDGAADVGSATYQNSLLAPEYLSRCQLFLISSDIACSPRTLHKIDLSAPAGQGLVHKAPFDPSGHAAGGEPTFVARDAAALSVGQCAEDDGWLVAYTIDIYTLESFCMVCALHRV